MINTALNYTGSKFKLLEQILPEMDYNKEIFVDLFCGSFVVGSNVVDKYKLVISNDIIENLVGIHKGLIENDDIIEKVKSLCPGKNNPEGYAKLRENFNLNNSPEMLYALMLSCTNNMMRFNKSYKFNQTYGNRGFSDSTQSKLDEFTKHIRPYKDKLLFYSTHFSKIEVPNNSMVYIDPPYSNTKAGYNAYWQKDDDTKLYNYIKNLDSNGNSFMLSGVLSHDNKPSILLENLIKDGFKYIELKCDYNKVSRKGKKETTEIIIKNY